MIYIAYFLIAVGFFVAGFYYCCYKTLMRLKDFIGKGDLPYMTVLAIIANDLKK